MHGQTTHGVTVTGLEDADAYPDINLLRAELTPFSELGGQFQEAPYAMGEIGIRDNGMLPQAPNPATGRTLEGDHPPLDLDPTAEGVQTGTDALGNLITDYTRFEARADWLLGSAGNDLMRGGEMNDETSGGAGDDRLEGGPGNDRLAAQTGADRIHGEAGYDSLTGGTEADWLEGGAGRDALAGEGGADQLYGGSGSDVLLGGAGARPGRGGRRCPKTILRQRAYYFRRIEPERLAA